jgi:ketosteroid isomerase-like protein
MPSSDTLERFIACVESNDHVRAIADFYTDDSSMQENQKPPRVGRVPNMAHEQVMMNRAHSVQSRCVRPAIMNGDHVVIRWVFDFVFKDGKTMHLEELAWQRWEGEKIAEETFFYDPAQMQAI